ncbi:MAG TPA: type II secretion system F family protein [Actinomycetes bacterium]|nr:type II secretion system F family protein [Actinomycetes bacterium]
MTALVALLGTGAAAGLALLVAGVVGFRPGPPKPRRPRSKRKGYQRLEVRLATAAGSALLMGLITRWPVGALLGGAFVMVAPAFLAGHRAAGASIAKLEAIAVWTEMLRDTMAAAAGLEHAIASTARVAPEAIRREVLSLAARLDSREPLSHALRDFADQLDDPSADLVIVSLVLAAEQRARHLVELLGALATATREEVTMRLRVETARARVRTSARIISLLAVLLATGLMLFDRGYLEPFGTLLGQFALLLVGCCFGVAFWWLAKMSRVEVAERFLTGDPVPAPTVARR